jgi:hypothetical protein
MDVRPPENGSPVRPGDILLFHGHGFVSWAIRRFDESDVDRAAIALGPEAMAEVTASGPRHVSIEPAVESSAFTYVRRLALHADASPGVERALAFEAWGGTPTYERIVLLAQLAMFRRLPLRDPTLRALLCVLFDRATGIVDRLRLRGGSLLTDAQFVFRCFETAGDPRVGLEVMSLTTVRARARPDAPPGITGDALLWEWVAARGRPSRQVIRRTREPLEPLIAAFAREDSPHDPILSQAYLPEAAAEPAKHVADDDIHVAAERFRDAILRLAEPYGARPGVQDEDRWRRFRELASVITSGDLRYSHSLQTVTSLRPADRSRRPSGRRGRTSHDADR